MKSLHIIAILALFLLPSASALSEASRSEWNEAKGAEIGIYDNKTLGVVQVYINDAAPLNLTTNKTYFFVRLTPEGIRSLLGSMPDYIRYRITANNATVCGSFCTAQGATFDYSRIESAIAALDFLNESQARAIMQGIVKAVPNGTAIRSAVDASNAAQNIKFNSSLDAVKSAVISALPTGLTTEQKRQVEKAVTEGFSAGMKTQQGREDTAYASGQRSLIAWIIVALIAGIASGYFGQPHLSKITKKKGFELVVENESVPADKGVQEIVALMDAASAQPQAADKAKEGA